MSHATGYCRSKVLVLAALLAVTNCVVGADQARGDESAPRPLVGAIRWDAWQPANTTAGTHWVTPKLYSEWSSRRPMQGWYLYGPGIDTQAVMDQEIDWAANHGLDYWAFVWYPENLGESVGGLMNAFHAYRSSALNDRLKFAFIMQTYWVASDAHEPYWRSSYVPDLVNQFKDHQYVRVAGNRPVLYWFGTSQLDEQADGFGTSWREQLQYLRDQTRGQLDDSGKLLGDPLIIDVNHDTAAASKFGLDGVASYGPSGAAPPAPGGCPDPRARSYAAQAAKDTMNLGPYDGLLTVPSPTAVNDPRPRDSDPDYPFHSYGFWTQPPTYSQWEDHLQQLLDWARANSQRTTDPPLLLIYAWNELDEGGAGIVPTDQEQFKYLDAINAVTSGHYPGEYDDIYNGDNCSIKFSGSGWIRYPGVIGAHDNDVQISWTSGDSAALQASNTTGFTISFSRGPDRGRADISVDNDPPDTVDLYSPSYDWWKYASGTLDKGTHTIRVTIRADRNKSSTGNQVPIDYVQVHVRRTMAWAFSRDGDRSGWSPDYQATATVSGGALHVTATGIDAQIYNPSFGSTQSLGLLAGANRIIHVRMRNNTTSTTAAIYFITDGDRTWNGTKYKSFPIEPNSGYTDYAIDMGTLPAWQGTIRKIRLDPGDPTVTGGTYDINSISTTDR